MIEELNRTPSWRKRILTVITQRMAWSMAQCFVKHQVSLQQNTTGHSVEQVFSEFIVFKHIFI